MTKEAFLVENPGLEAALRSGHYIVQDIAARFARYGSLSPKQVALVLKIAGEAALRAAEKNVPAPTGRREVRGKIVSLKLRETRFGVVPKMTVKFETPEGVWRAWGTRPASLGHAEVGEEVAFTATFATGRDAHFALFSRPVDGRRLKVVDEYAAEEAEVEREREAA